MRCWWSRVNITLAVLWLAVFYLFFEEVLGTSSAPVIFENDNVSQSRRNWCEERNACDDCEERKRPRCLRQREPVLGADLCECCFSCIVIRGLGESCGSQLSILPDKSSSLSATILATTWCRQGLICVNFTCLDSSGKVQPRVLSLLNRDREFIESKKDTILIETLEPHQDGTTPLWERMIVSHDDPKSEEIIPSTPIPLLIELIKKSEPCYGKIEETMTISSYPSDNRLGQVSTIWINDKWFQIVYNGDLISELTILLNVVDTCHEDSLLDENTVNLLMNGLSVPTYNDSGIFSSHRDKLETIATPNPYNILFSIPREKREMKRSDDETVGYNSPVRNIQEILIRGASAHREYASEARGYDENVNNLNKSGSGNPVEVSSQEDESTVRVHITNRPRKVQTLIELEEDDDGKEEEKIKDDGRRGLQLANKGHGKDVGRLSPLAEEQYQASLGIPKPLEQTVATIENTVTKKTTIIKPTDVPRIVNTISNDTPMTLNDRLTLVEHRIGIFERVLEEIAKWCNLGVFLMGRDCLMAQQNAETHNGKGNENVDEHFGVASGIDAVRIRGNVGNKLNGNVPLRDEFHDTKIPDVAVFESPRQTYHRGRYQPDNRNFFRTLTDNGSSRRYQNLRHEEFRRRLKPPCRYHGNRRTPWRQPIAKFNGDTPAHRNVQRSVSSSKNSQSNGSLGLEKAIDLDVTAANKQFDTLAFGDHEETQIPLPTTFAKKVLTLEDLERRELSPQEDTFPHELTSTRKIIESHSIQPWKMFAASKNNENDDEENESLFSGISWLENKDRSRKKRSVKREKKQQNINARSSPLIKQGEKLFERESITGRKRFEPEINGNKWEKMMMVESNGKPEGSRSPLTMIGNRELRKFRPEPIANRLLFRNSKLLHTKESIAATVTPMILKNEKKLFDLGEVMEIVMNNRNSTNQIEEINKNEYEYVPQQIHGVEDDFDHLYEGIESEDEDEDFEYDVMYDKVEYVDGSSVEIVTEKPETGFGKSEIELKTDLKILRDKTASTTGSAHDRNRRDSISKNDECESEKKRKNNEIPLFSFGSTEKHEPKMIL